MVKCNNTSWFNLHAQLASLVLESDGQAPTIVSANVPTFGPECIASMRKAVRMLLGAGVRINYRDSEARIPGSVIRMYANADVG